MRTQTYSISTLERLVLCLPILLSPVTTIPGAAVGVGEQLLVRLVLQTPHDLRIKLGLLLSSRFALGARVSPGLAHRT